MLRNPFIAYLFLYSTFIQNYIILTHGISRGIENSWNEYLFFSYRKSRSNLNLKTSRDHTQKTLMICQVSNYAINYISIT